MIKSLRSASLRKKLLLGLGGTIVWGLVIAALFVAVTKSQVRRILDDDMSKMARFVAGLVESDYEAKRSQAHQLADENALRVVLDLNLPAQAGKILSRHEEESPFDCLWLLDAKGDPIASSRGGDHILLPPVVLGTRRDSFLKWDQDLAAIFVSPIIKHTETIGYLVALCAFPGRNVFDLIDQKDDIGLAIWLDRAPAAASPWLQQTGYFKLGFPVERKEISFKLGQSDQKFMATPFGFPAIKGSRLLKGELIRSLEQAEQPFALVSISFYVGLALILVSMALFSRYVSIQVIRPIQKLSRHADSIRVGGDTGDLPAIMTDSADTNEVAALYRSFYEMVCAQNEARSKAEQAEQIKTDFLSVVSHELRTPMTSVLGFTKMNRKKLKDHVYGKLDPKDEKSAKAVRQIEDNFDIVLSEGNRLTDLINDVLDLAKLESGAMEWNFRATDLKGLLQQSVAACNSLLHEKDIECRMEIEPLLPKVRGDYDKLVQVMINLLSNAIKFTNEGDIVCSARREGDEVIVSVADSGIGIPKEEQGLIFQRFHQRRETLTDKPQGTGLGLPICKNIIKSHQGRLWLESEPGKGSTFLFSVPVHQ